MKDRLRINFVLPPAPVISGGPLAILEYATRLRDRGHSVSITTYPDSAWSSKSPFPWFDFKGPIYFKHLRNIHKAVLPPALPEVLRTCSIRAVSETVISAFGAESLREVILESCRPETVKDSVEFILQELITWLHVMDAMPECDLNIATLWSTAFPVFFSRKGKPVYFMQHYEEIFYPLQPSLIHRMLARMSYELPLYKVANSSWLQQVIRRRFGQEVPFSNNALNIADFSAAPKLSAGDGIIRVVTYSRPEDWKGFGDAVVAMSSARAQLRTELEWHVFGYRYSAFPEDNPHAPYTYHPKLSFAELGKLYATSDIALCPSWYESFPLPPLEAMASGTAVITTSSGTEDYAMNETNSLVVGPRDIEAMAHAVCQLARDKALRERLAAAGRLTAARFTWDRAVEERERILLDIYHGRVAYDLLAAAKLDLKDASGIPFEQAPPSVTPDTSGLFWSGSALFLLHGGMRRHVTNPELIPVLLDRHARLIELDELQILRIPPGLPIYTEHDVPAEL